jgi:hypothetical protein
MKRILSILKINNYAIFFCVTILFLGIYIYFPNNVLSWDTFGAYLYLPANFIYEDTYIQNMDWINQINSIYNNTPTFYQFAPHSSGNNIIQYPSGFALIYLPFFLIAHIFASLSSTFPADGFSFPYQMGVITGHIFYIISGLVLANKVLLHFFSEKLTAILLVILFFSTNFLVISIFMIGMPHGHLFAFYALIILYTIKWHENPSQKNSIILGATIGIACLIRVSEILSIFIPILWNITNKDSVLQKIEFLKANGKNVGIMILSFILPAFIQLSYYKTGTGEYFYNAYQNHGEGFDLGSPYLMNFLFSYRKGWLLYTPIMLIALGSLIWMWKNKRKNKVLVSITVFTILNIYLLSSWTCWWYAESFGQRSMVQSYLIYIIPLGFLMEYLMKQNKKVILYLGLITGFFTFLNIFQSYQTQNGLIHPSRTTKESYWAHFLSLNFNPNFDNLLLLDKGKDPYDELNNGSKHFKSTSTPMINFDSEKWVYTQKAEDNMVYEVLTDQEYSKVIQIPFEELSNTDEAIYKVSAEILMVQYVNESVKPILVTKLIHKKKAYSDKYMEIKSELFQPENSWQKIEMTNFLPTVRNPKDKFEFFIWNRGGEVLKIRNVQITVYTKTQALK